MPSAKAKPSDLKQKRLIHTLARRLGWDDDEYRGWLELKTGKSSAKDLTYREATLFLDLLFAMVNGRQPPRAGLDAATSFELAKLSDLRSALGAARFDGLAKRLSRGRTADPAEMTARQSRALIQAARSILAREEGGRAALATKCREATPEGIIGRVGQSPAEVLAELRGRAEVDRNERGGAGPESGP